jgi:hypothetical protein
LKQERSLPGEDLRPLGLGEEAAPHLVAGPMPPPHSTQEHACCNGREREKVKKRRKFPACCKRERERKNTTCARGREKKCYAREEMICLGKAPARASHLK